MRCIVKKTLNKIVGKGNHYVVKVKNNQPKLRQALEKTTKTTKPIDSHVEEKIIRGRCEIRTTLIYEREDNLAKGWESIKRIIVVRRDFLSKRKEHKTDSIYISDIQNNSAEYFAKGIRSHWGIENKLHYTKDVTMREDKECTKDKQAAANLALFRDFAFNILKTKNKSIKYASECFQNYTVKQILLLLIE